MTPAQTIAITGLGLAAGFLGGLAGVGGSLLILPALGLIFGYPNQGTTQHLYQAAAMATNVVVAIPAAYKHWKRGAVNAHYLRTLVPVVAISLITGVLISNEFPGWHLMFALGGFQVVYCLWMIRQVVHKRPDYLEEHDCASTSRLAFSSVVTGTIAGLLGLGGGIILVPMLQWICRTPLRRAIATSSATICLTACIGAAVKLATLGQHHEQWTEALLLAAWMTPGAVIGAVLGAEFTHRFPLAIVRVAIVSLLTLSAMRLIAKGGQTAGWW